jgi:hypothetical protein
MIALGVAILAWSGTLGLWITYQNGLKRAF